MSKFCELLLLSIFFKYSILDLEGEGLFTGQ